MSSCGKSKYLVKKIKIEKYADKQQNFINFSDNLKQK